MSSILLNYPHLTDGETEAQGSNTAESYKLENDIDSKHPIHISFGS